MKLKYIVSFTIIIVFLLSMNFIAAGDINSTDLDDNCLKIECDESISESPNNELVNLDQVNDESSDLISNSGDGLNHIYVSPEGKGTGSNDDPADFETTLKDLEDNTVIHMLDGNYTWKFDKRTDTISLEVNNVCIMAENYGNVMLNSTCSFASTEYELDSCNNITFKNIIFHSSPSADYLFEITDSTDVYFEKCGFINYLEEYEDGVLEITASHVFINNCYFINDGCKWEIIDCVRTVKSNLLSVTNCTFDKIKSNTIIEISRGNNANIIGCNFINSTLYEATINVGDVQKSAINVNISNCIFNVTSVLNLKANVENLTFKNNTVNSKYSIYLIGGKINSQTTLTILNNTQLTATSGDVINITAVLVDDMGNYINIPKLDFSIDGVTYSATYKDGVYSVAYTVPEVTQPEEISFDSTPESTYLGDLTVKYQPLFLLAKPALNMTMSNVSDSVYGDNVTVKVNISSLESGNLIYQFIKDDVVVKTVTDSFSNNMSTVSVNDLPAGDYTVAVKYAEDDNFGATTITKTFTVSKANSTVQILIDPTIPVGDNITVQAIVPANAGGNVTFRLNTDNKTVNVTDKAVFDGLANGTYIIYAVYNGDDNYNPSEEVNVTFEVVKVNPTINIEYSTPVINENVTVTVTMNEDINGDVNVTINKLDPVVEHVVNGILVFNITNVPYGPQNITVSFTGNDKYNAGEKNASFFVNKLDVDLRISADAITYGEPLVVIVNANEKFTGEVIVKIGTLNQTVNVVNGKGNATFNNLTADDYFINATFTGDETFYADSANTTATVKGVEVPASQALTTNVPANTKSPTFSIKLEKDATGTFTVNIDNGKIVKTAELKDGAASITVADLAAGDHTISVSYSGDGKYAPITQNTTLNIKEPVKPTTKVTKKATKIVAKKKTFKAKKKTKKYTITLKSGKKLISKVKVTIKVGKKTYTAKTNKKGKATFNLKKLTKKGKYTAVIKFKGNKNYKATSKKVKITVKK